MLYLVPAHSSSVLSIFNLSLFADIQLSMSVMQRSRLGVVAGCGNFLRSTVNIELSVISVSVKIDIILYNLVDQVRRVHDKQPRAED